MISAETNGEERQRQREEEEEEEEEYIRIEREEEEYELYDEHEEEEEKKETGIIEEEEEEQQQKKKKEEEEESAFSCNICFDEAESPVITQCGHLYCWPCLHAWLNSNKKTLTCPVCKSGIIKEKIIPLYGRGTTKAADISKNPNKEGTTTNTTTTNTTTNEQRPTGQRTGNVPNPNYNPHNEFISRTFNVFGIPIHTQFQSSHSTITLNPFGLLSNRRNTQQQTQQTQQQQQQLSNNDYLKHFFKRFCFCMVLMYFIYLAPF